MLRMLGYYFMINHIPRSTNVANYLSQTVNYGNLTEVVFGVNTVELDPSGVG